MPFARQVLYTLAVTYLSVLLSTRLEHGESMLEETGACCAISCGELTKDELGKVDKVRREASRAFLALPVPPSLTVCALRCPSLPFAALTPPPPRPGEAASDGRLT